MKLLAWRFPTTVDEWHEVLTAFKEKKVLEAPLALTGQTSRIPTPLHLHLRLVPQTAHSSFWTMKARLPFAPLRRATRNI